MRDVGTIYRAADFASLPKMEYPISLGNSFNGITVSAETPKDTLKAIQRVFVFGLAPVSIMESEEI